MAHYRKRPIQVDAVQWTGSNLDEIRDLTEGSHQVSKDSASSFLFVNTLEGAMRCAIGDWLIRDDHGNFYPCWDKGFQATYEAVDVLETA